MTEPDPYAPATAELLDVDDDVPLPSKWKRFGMSLAFSYSAVLPIWAYTAITAMGGAVPPRDFLLMPILLLLVGSIGILPSWFVVFLPVVLAADPKSGWVRSGWLTVFGAIVGAGWGWIFSLDPETSVTLVFVIVGCGALPGFLYGRWNSRFLQRKSHA